MPMLVDVPVDFAALDAGFEEVEAVLLARPCDLRWQVERVPRSFVDEGGAVVFSAPIGSPSTEVVGLQLLAGGAVARELHMMREIVLGEGDTLTLNWPARLAAGAPRE